jgi:hypothetical protein
MYSTSKTELRPKMVTEGQLEPDAPRHRKVMLMAKGKGKDGDLDKRDEQNKCPLGGACATPNSCSQGCKKMQD